MVPVFPSEQLATHKNVPFFLKKSNSIKDQRLHAACLVVAVLEPVGSLKKELMDWFIDQKVISLSYM